MSDNHSNSILPTTFTTLSPSVNSIITTIHPWFTGSQVHSLTKFKPSLLVSKIKPFYLKLFTALKWALKPDPPSVIVILKLKSVTDRLLITHSVAIQTGTQCEPSLTQSGIWESTELDMTLREIPTDICFFFFSLKIHQVIHSNIFFRV